MTSVGSARNRGATAFVTHTRSYAASDVLAALARNGFSTTERPHDRDTARMLAMIAPDVVVLAINPEERADLELVRETARLEAGALIVLSPSASPLAMSAALAAGADLCLRDSDGPDVIAAQLTAVRRRIQAATDDLEPASPDAVVVVSDLALDFDRCQAIRDGEVIPLTPTEFKILAHLARNAGRVISPVDILRAVQDYTYTEREAQEIVKVYIRRIRRKIEDDASDPRYVVNVRGFGYMLEREPRANGRHAA